MDDPGAVSPRWLGPVIGLVTAGVTLGVAHLAAGWVDAAASPVITVGEATIDSSPTWLKSFAIRSFGANDKHPLELDGPLGLPLDWWNDLPAARVLLKPAAGRAQQATLAVKLR